MSWNDFGRIIFGDCLVELKKIPKSSVDMILTDLPYGKTTKDWDNKIDISILWDLWKTVLKDNGVVALTSIEPFTSELIMSNKDWFKY